MRPAPPLQFTVSRFGAWRCAVASLLVATFASVAAWQVGLHEDALLAGPAARITLAVLTLAGLAAASRLAWMRPLSLRWDAQRWHLGPAGTVGHEPHTGRLRVAVDLGAWMLLRFDADGPSRRAVVHWVPVQKAGLGQAWHAVRCTVYSPRPESGPLSFASAGSASTRPLPPE